MKKKKYIQLHPDEARKQPNYHLTGIPIMGKIKEMDGKLFAEIIGYRMPSNNSISLEESNPAEEW